jgi:hypothetical protein
MNNININNDKGDIAYLHRPRIYSRSQMATRHLTAANNVTIAVIGGAPGGIAGIVTTAKTSVFHRQALANEIHSVIHQQIHLMVGELKVDLLVSEQRQRQNLLASERRLRQEIYQSEKRLQDEIKVLYSLLCNKT